MSYYYEYRSYILIILMRIYSVKSSKYGISCHSCTQMYYVISWKRYLFPCNRLIVYGEIGQGHKDYSTMTSGGLQ